MCRSSAVETIWPAAQPQSVLHNLAVGHLRIATGVRRRQGRVRREDGVLLRLNDVLVDIAVQGLSGNLLDHEPKKHGVGAVVVELCVGWKLRWMLDDDLEKVLVSVPALRVVGHRAMGSLVTVSRTPNAIGRLAVLPDTDDGARN